MKKKIAIAVIFVCGILAFFVPYFFSNSWRNVELKREVIQSDIYERKDVEHAMTLVEHTFSQELQECKLTRISYDESAYRQFADSFRKQKSDEVIVVYTDFITVSNVFHAGDHTLEPYTTLFRSIHGYCGAHPLRRSGLSSVRDMVFCIPERYQRIDVDKAFHLPFFFRQHIRLSEGVV